MDYEGTITGEKTEVCGVHIHRVETDCKINDWLSAASLRSYPALLESSLYNPKQGRYSILCWDPYKKITFNNNVVVINDFRSSQTRHVSDQNPFKTLSLEFEKDRLHGASNFPLPFAGGAIGYFSYDLRHSIESLSRQCQYDIPVPEFILCFYDRALIFDHKNESIFFVGEDLSDFNELHQDKMHADNEEKLKNTRHASSGKCRLQSSFTPERYLKCIEKVKEYISAGDIFQANISQRFEGACDKDGIDIYKRLRSINPAPFSAFLRYPEFEIISSSPERFLLLDQDKVMTRPIKGTRPRDENAPAFNKKMKRELTESEKDHAELAMIVDLERNDLGRVCSYGSVRVKEHAVLETYPTVYHLVSTIEGRLYRPQNNEFDLLHATFPGGSITGTPKIRAMEIIEELEPVARNIYTGSIGYLSFHGRMDMNILIRTMLKANGRIYMQFGGGIVADSDPESEYNETIQKGNALFQAINADNYDELMATANDGC